jgi:hypothetical protein
MHRRDLLVLVADKNMRACFEAALNRPQALGIRPIDFEIKVHAERDGGMRTKGAAVAAMLRPRYEHALLALDYQGCGAQITSALELEHRLDRDLHDTWGDSGKFLVVDPEVDIWLWGADSHLEQVLGWSGQSIGIRAWLAGQGHRFLPNNKPEDPKTALEAVFREVQKPRSSSYYEAITKRISLNKCGDPAFLRARETLHKWFGV